MDNLTRECILNMPAGRELNDLIAVHVFGWDIPEEYDGDLDFSGDMGAAWEVVERVQLLGGDWYAEVHRVSAMNTLWHAVVGECHVTADTAPLAICRAALLAVVGAQP